MTTSLKNNKYDKMIIWLILCLAYGYIGSILYHPIILSVVLFFPVFIQNASLLGIPKNRKTLGVFVFLLLYSMLSLIWAPSFSSSLMLLFRAFLHILLCLELIIFSQKANNPLDSISYGWMLAFLLTAGIAIWEMVTDNHIMTIAHEDMGMDMEIVRRRAAVTFYNMNTYSMFVVFALPFVLYRILIVDKKIKRLFLSLVLLVLVSILLLNASRGAIFSMAIMIGVFVLNTVRRGNRRVKWYSIAILFLLAIFLYIWGDFLLEAILYRTEGRDVFQDQSRNILINCSWKLFLESYGFGHGIGSMIPELSKYPGNTTTLTYSHNLFLELLLEGGVVYGLCFIIFFIKLIRSAFHQKTIQGKFFLFSVILAFPLYSVINSAYISPTFVWAFFVSVYIFSFSLNKEYVEIT